MPKAFDLKSKKRRSATPESDGSNNDAANEPHAIENDVPPAEFYDSPPPIPPAKSLTVINLLLAIILIGLLITSGVLYQRSRNSVEPDSSTTEAASSTIRDQLAGSQTPVVAEEPTPKTPEPATTTVEPSSISVRVLNGSGQAGAAQQLADQLKAAGYTVNGVGNAKRFSYSETTIFYHTGKRAAADAIAAALSANTPLLEEENTVTTDVDVVVVAGP